MKLKQWLYGAAALAILGACSEQDLVVQDQSVVEDVSGEGNKASGYLAFQINLPQQPITRAVNADNVEFNDGEAWEYKVNDAMLLLFKTSSETETDKDAEFFEAYELKRAFSPTDPANDQISASSVEAVSVDVDDIDNTYLWALVMLNVPTELAMPSENQKFSDYIKTTSEQSFIKTNGGQDYIFMTNAPLSANQGGSNSPSKTPSIHTLASLGKASDAIHPTLQEARENVAGCVYVERGLAKFTASIKNPTISINGNGVDDEGKPVALNITIDSNNSYYGLDHINPTSYIVRNVYDFPTTLDNENPFAWNMASKKVNYFRMVGEVGMPIYDNHPLLHDQINPNLYRTYWCVDPNYEKAFPTTATSSDAALKKMGTGAAYAKENTFTVKNQNYGNTTLAVFKICFNTDGSAKDLYIINDNHDVVYSTEKDATSYVYQYILAQDAVKNALLGSVKSGVTGTIDNLEQFLKVTFARNDKGVYEATGITLNNEAPGYGTYYDGDSAETFKTKLTDATIKDLVNRVNLLYVVTQYKGGVSYYTIPIKHFGDISTPWTATEGKNQTETKEAYCDDEAGKYNSGNYLGRYGMVRNNWYEIEVTSFNGLGYPVFPKVTGTLSDDNQEVKQYIGIETHILSWAKRTQSVNF